MKKILYIIIFTSVFLGKDTIAQDKYDMLNYGAANLFYKKYSEAIQNFTEVLENSPNNIFALQNRAQCFLNSNQVEKAIEQNIANNTHQLLVKIGQKLLKIKVAPPLPKSNNNCP